MKNKDIGTSAIHEKSTGESSNKISKKENRIITILMFGVMPSTSDGGQVH